MEGVLYCNDGDWVESCTALVELASGELQIVDWAASRRSLPVRAAA
jgi:UDP-2,3-diacylglucosamine pyrophosphatase LpxH